MKLKSIYIENEDQIIKVFRTLSFIYNLMVGSSVIVLFIVEGTMGKDNVIFQSIGSFWGLTIVWFFLGFPFTLIATDRGGGDWGYRSLRLMLTVIFLPPGILAAILVLAGY